MTRNNSEQDALPFIAPCRVLEFSAPWRWLKKGVADVHKAPLASLSYGLVMMVLLMSMVILAWQSGSAWIMLSLICGSVFLAPLACIGTYAISAQIERGLRVSIKRTLRACFQRHIGTALVFILVMMVVFLVWARAGSMVSIFLPSSGDYESSEVLSYMLVLTLVSLVFLSIIFAASVFSLPMIMHRDVDAVTAVVTSINAVLRNKSVMVMWALLITLAVVVGILTAGLALIYLLPAIGHAVWHGYLDTIDVQAFPRHLVGITSEPRPGSN